MIGIRGNQHRRPVVSVEVRVFPSMILGSENPLPKAKRLNNLEVSNAFTASTAALNSLSSF